MPGTYTASRVDHPDSTFTMRFDSAPDRHYPATCMEPEAKSKRTKTAHYDPERVEAFRIAMIEHPISIISLMFEDGSMDDDEDVLNCALEMAHDSLNNLQVAYAANPEMKSRRERRERRARKGV